MQRHKLGDMVGGWFVGDFSPTVLRTNVAEVSVKSYLAGESAKSHLHKVATEVTVIVSGQAIMNGQTLNGGDIVTLEPGEPADFHAVTDVLTVVVKTPSVAGDKYDLPLAPLPGEEPFPEPDLQQLSKQASEALDSGDTALAIQLWQAVRERAPHELAPFMGGVLAYRHANDHANAEALLKETLERFPFQPDAAIAYALYSYNRQDWAELTERWALIPRDCDRPNYHGMTFQVFLYAFMTDRLDKADDYFEVLLEEPVTSWERSLPLAVYNTLTSEPDRPLFTKVTDWMRDYFARRIPSGTVAELVAMVFYFPYPHRNEVLWRWSLDHDLKHLTAIFQNITIRDGCYVYEDRGNFYILQGIANLLLGNNTVSTLDGIQAYHYALLLSTGDRGLFTRFLQTATLDGTATDDLTQPMGVLCHAWREIKAAKADLSAPALVSTKKLRIALCISGQLRGYEQAKQSWDKFGFAGHDVDSYVHSWTAIGRKFPYVAHADRCFSGEFLEEYRRVATAISEVEMRRRYPAFYAFFQNGGNEATVEGLSELYGTKQVVLEDDRSGQFLEMTNSTKMYYKTEACFNLAKASGKNYDLVIRIRPDKEVASCEPVDWCEVHSQLQQNHMIYAATKSELHWLIGYMVDDQFAIGDAACMDKYSRAYSFTFEAVRNRYYGFPQGFGGHINFAHTAFRNGIHVTEMPGLTFGSLLDPQTIAPDILFGLLQEDLLGRDPDLYDQRLMAACQQDMLKRHS